MNAETGRHQGALREIWRRPRIHRLELFGSAATGRDRPGESDLDFLVELEPLASGTYADTYFGLRDGLEELFRRPVDLVVASAIKNPYLRQSVEETKALLYAGCGRDQASDASA